MPVYSVTDKPFQPKSDPGSGTWCSAPQTAGFLTYKRAIEMALDTGGLDLSIGPLAVAHMRHYMDDTGSDLPVDLNGLLARSKTLRSNYDKELAEAKEFCETLPLGRHPIGSTRARGGYFQKTESLDLYFAIGGYACWGQGLVEIGTGAGTLREYVLQYEFHFHDRYNWDHGKSVTIAGFRVTDDFMQNFHQQCYAREFDMKGVLRTGVKWSAPLRVASQPSANPFAVLQGSK